MKKFNLILFTILYYLITTISYAAEYKISLLGTETLGGVRWIGLLADDCFGINDNGQIFGICLELDEFKYNPFVIDNKNGIKIIHSNNESLSPRAINNVGQLIGMRNGSELFIWNEKTGIQKISIFNSKYVRPIALNDCGQIIGNYRTISDETRPFLWTNNAANDMGPGSKFTKEIEAHGYHVMAIQILSINNSGHMAGYFTNGKYNNKQKKYINIETFPFYWDGDFHLIPVNLPLDFSEHQEKIKLNNHGVVLVSHGTETYLWDKQNGLQVLSNFKGFFLTDSNVVFGSSIWRDGRNITLSELLGADINNLAPPFSDDYRVERIGHVFGMNNKGQILCSGYLWGEWHPCILEPIEESQ